jgi:hypothetical protein
VDLAQVWRELQVAGPIPLGLAVCVGIVSNLLRAARWKAILQTEPPVRFRFFFTSMMIGYLANNLLPARLGELVRIYVLRRQAGVSKSTAAATVVLERLTDGLVLLALVMLISLLLPLPPSVRSGSEIGLALFSVFAVFLLFLAFRGENIVRLATPKILSLPLGLGPRLRGILERFIDGLGVFRSRKQALFTIALTLAIWAVEALLAGLVMTSLGLSLPWTASLLLVVVLSLTLVIPAAPGALGTYEFFAVMALSPFAVAKPQAVGAALVLHAVVYSTSTLLGLGSLWMESVSLRELTAKAPREAV